MRAFGTSMVPSIWPGDIVTIEQIRDKNEVGSIVLAIRDDRLYLHRLVGTESSHGGTFFITQGDAMPRPDPACSQDRVIGKVVCIHHDGRSTVPRMHRSLFARFVAWMFCHSALLRRILMRVWASPANTRWAASGGVKSSVLV